MLLPIRKRLPLLIVAGATLAAQAADAAVVTFTNRAAWEAAAGGLPSINETFNSFVNDTGVPVDVGPFTISSTEPETFIDAPPVDTNTNVNGTSFVFTRLDVIGGDELVTFTFDSPVFSWGADLRPFPGDAGETFNVALSNGATTTLTLPATSTAAFRGFISDTSFTSVTFSTTAALSLDGFTDFGADNVSAHTSLVAAVPEPTSLTMFGLGAMGCAAAALRRRQRAR